MSHPPGYHKTESKKNIGFIAPLWPYRGGIANYSTLLHRAVGKRRNIKTVSFKSFYPPWLYPGKSTLEPGYENHREPGVEYVITPFNPLSWMKACRLFRDSSVDCVIISWWTIFWGPCFWFIMKFLQWRRTDVVFLCHNVLEHETAFWKVIFTRLIFSGTDGFLVQSTEQKQILEKLVGKADVLVHPHPVFSHSKKCVKKRPRKAKLELLFMGFVREYKGLDILADAMEILKHEDIHLSVVGEWWIDDKKLKKRLKNMGRVELVDRYLGKSELHAYLCGADVVVIPYRRVSGTGILPCAYFQSKPVIATCLGGLREMVDDGVTGRIVPPENPRALALAIREFLQGSIRIDKQAILRKAGQMTWDGLAESILSFLDDRLSGKQPSMK